MISPTQTMENTTEVEYISIYDRPKRGRGRPKTCTLTDEEKRQRKIEIAKQYYKHNFEGGALAYPPYRQVMFKSILMIS